MTCDAPAGAPAPAESPLFPLGCVAVWAAAAASGRLLGIWTALGAASLALGIAVFLAGGAAARKLLQPRLLHVLAGAAAGGAMAAATYLLYPPLVRVAPFLGGDLAHLYSAFRAPSRAVVALALAPVVLGEELVWRGVVQTAAAGFTGPARGVALSAVLYALALAPLGSPVLVLAALACGLCWSALRAATGSLVPPLVAHLVWDSVVLLWLPLISK